jgi:type II secretory pathway pseudopilin PulG
LLGHDLHTPNAKSLVKQSYFFGSFSLSLPARAQYHALLTTKSMAKSSPPSVEHAFTLIELLVVIAGTGILLGIAVPALNSAYERVKVTKDMSNLRQIGLGVQLYLNDKDGILPVINAAPGIGTNASPVICPKYIATKKVFQSPFDKRGDSEGDDAPVSYGINQNIYDLIGGNMTRVGGAGMTSGPQRNGAQINALFCDLHAQTMRFGLAGTAGTFHDATSDPLGLKRWDPTK